MAAAFAIARRELRSYFVSPIAYIVAAAFLVLGGWFFFAYLLAFSDYIMRYNQMGAAAQMGLGSIPPPNLNDLVIEGYFHTLLIILVFVVPMLTMKVIAEERRSGTFELLITSPLQVRDIVIGKLLALAGVLAIMILVASSFPLILAYFGNPEVPPMLSGMLAVFLSAVGFASIGIAVSSCTDNQIIAAVVTLVILLVLYAIDAIGQSFGVGVQEVLRSLSPVDHARGMIDGVIEIKSLVYFGLLILSGAFLSCRSLEAFRWR